MPPKKSAWNSLEVAKLIVGILMPVSLAIFGVIAKDALQESQAAITSALNEKEHQLILNRELISKRGAIYEQIRIPLNNIYCYIEEVGGYKSMTPVSIIKDRRFLHKTMHTQRAYWSPNTFNLYLKYMDEEAFMTWQGINKDALIRDNPGQKASLTSWNESWRKKFEGNQSAQHKSAYDTLLNAIANDLSVSVSR